MKVEFMPGVIAVSGSTAYNRNGVRLMFQRRQSDKPNHGRVYLRTRESYQRKTELRDSELAARQLFKERAALVQELMREKHLTKAAAWKRAKKQIVEPQNL